MVKRWKIRRRWGPQYDGGRRSWRIVTPPGEVFNARTIEECWEIFDQWRKAQTINA
jgi:hypothetical protein